MAYAWFNYEFLNAVDDINEQQEVRLLQRGLRDNSNPFEIPETAFRMQFRLPRNIAFLLCQELSNYLPKTQRVTAIPNHLKVLTALNFYCAGSYQNSIAKNYNFAVSQPTASRIINEVSTAITNHLAPRYIKFPTSEEDIRKIKEGFMNRFNFPGVIGCIDGTQIPIISPPINHQEFPGISYYNRKGYFSLNVQIICDSDLKITSINARYPGSSHDSAIWMTSSINLHMQNKYYAGDRHTWLLGDSGYPTQPYLLTPIVDAAPNTPEERYTKAHCSIRNTVERLMGVLKGRFRCLHKHRALHYSPTKAGKIIYACAVLHNICRNYNVDNEPPDENEDDDEDEEAGHHNQAPQYAGNLLTDGRRIRQELINNHFI